MFCIRENAVGPTRNGGFMTNWVDLIYNKPFCTATGSHGSPWSIGHGHAANWVIWQDLSFPLLSLQPSKLGLL